MPVTHVPTGKVKLHQVSANGSPRRAVRVEGPGVPDGLHAELVGRDTLTLVVAPELAAGTLRAIPVTGVDLTRTLRAVWTEGRRLTGPALDLYAIAARSTRSLAGPRARSRARRPRREA